MANIIFKISTNATAQNIRNLFSFSSKRLGKFLSNAAELPQARCSVQLLNDDDVAASATLTIDQSKQTADDTIKIGAMTLTAKASGATTNQFNIGGTSTISAANIALAINTYSSSLLFATSAAGVVTVRAASTGTLGNAVAIVLSQADTGVVASPSGALAGGLGDTSVAKDFSKF